MSRLKTMEIYNFGNVMRNVKKIFFTLLFFILIYSVNGQNKTLKVGNVLPGELDMGAFNLSQRSSIDIKGFAASFDQWNKYLNYYAWILETDNRNVIWKTTMSSDYEEEGGEYEVDKQLELSPGNYEVYFTSGSDYKKYESFEFDRFLGSLFKKKKNHVDEYQDKFFITIAGSPNTFKIMDPEDVVDKRNSKAIVAIVRVGDYEKIEKKFSLSKATEVNIYGLGEGINNQFYDFGYIYDVKKNKRVWMFNKYDAERAGGGYKNIKVEKKLTLPKGSYYVRYTSDDSHSFDEWNVLPPDDPQYWGITIFPASEADSKHIIPFRKTDVIKPFVDLSKVQDDELRSQGFSLSKDLKVRVLSIGEGIHEMVDYGWIMNADTHETVWKMRRRSTEYAGGAKKNRMIDEVINLKKGNYIAYYVTDDSHSFMNWNDAPPYQAEDWGIKIWTINKKDTAYVTPFDAENYVNKNLIVEIVRVGDDELLSKDFTLDEESKIRVVAIGEGRGNRMFDYGWIENSGGETVWKMRYNKTIHAGGAKKNRKYNAVITLPKGEYKVFFKTDDSHSYPEWNSTPPDEKERYGITILRE